MTMITHTDGNESGRLIVQEAEFEALGLIMPEDELRVLCDTIIARKRKFSLKGSKDFTHILELRAIMMERGFVFLSGNYITRRELLHYVKDKRILESSGKEPVLF